MNLLSMAQEYVRILPNADGDKDEYWETPQARAEAVLAAFLRDRDEPVWKLTFYWHDDENVRTSNHYFILEETMETYYKECKHRIPPTRVVKCLTHTPNKI